MKLIIKSFFFTLAIILLGRCNLDINVDPNNPTDVPVNQILTAVEVDLAGALGTNIGGLSGYTGALVHP